MEGPQREIIQMSFQRSFTQTPFKELPIAPASRLLIPRGRDAGGAWKFLERGAGRNLFSKWIVSLAQFGLASDHLGPRLPRAILETYCVATNARSSYGADPRVRPWLLVQPRPGQARGPAPWAALLFQVVLGFRSLPRTKRLSEQVAELSE